MRKQIIRIEVTWANWDTLKLNLLITFLASQGLTIKRLIVTEPKK